MLLKVTGMTKTYFGVTVLDHVNFELHAGEVHALLGQNGAGKSTLVKLISGVEQPDQGEIAIEGRHIRISSTMEAQKLGISTIYQETSLVPDMTVAENIFMGREPRRLGGFVHYGKMKRETKRILKQLGYSIHPNSIVRDLSHSEQQAVSIAKALSMKCKIIIMDEPTASLTEQECERLFQIIRLFKSEGVGIIYITHRLQEVRRICDRVTILKDGQHVMTGQVDRYSEKEMITYMVGRELSQYFPPVADEIGQELMRVERLSKKHNFYDVSFTLHEGEILGIAGLADSGGTELANALFGRIRPDAGTIYWRNERVLFKNPREAIHHRFGLVDKDRLKAGMFTDMPISKNLTMSGLRHLNKLQFIDLKKEQDKALDAIIQLDIKMLDPDQEIKFLSGGNQQKVMFGRWLVAESELYILNEPTRGVDVGAKSELYSVIRELVLEGKGVIIISSDLAELIGLSTRILVMRDGRVVDMIEHESATESRIISAASGLPNEGGKS
ncbi:sugar ABC transporter ATP-binding protein [Cohnella caldifontis]|uniref:sugar ABC transporter ATP-binding protein n=1 Tax=Cohnella caldifontis TaxID=3027471 RepID=UPI0023EC9713|nr:sugar ABC transporter ATP-binding protein [Cohnella sp. YIM B05605]